MSALSHLFIIEFHCSNSIFNLINCCYFWSNYCAVPLSNSEEIQICFCLCHNNLKFNFEITEKQTMDRKPMHICFCFLLLKHFTCRGTLKYWISWLLVKGLMTSIWATVLSVVQIWRFKSHIFADIFRQFIWNCQKHISKNFSSTIFY